MRWILLLTYGSLVAAIVFAFFRAGLQPRQPRNLPLVAGAVMFLLVVGVGAQNYWWQDTAVNRGVPE